MATSAHTERTLEQHWEIVLEGLESRNVAETCRRYEISPSLYYRWKNEAKRRATVPATDRIRDRRLRRLEQLLARKALELKILRKVVVKAGCGRLHSQARELVQQSYNPTLVASALTISRSSLYYRSRPRKTVKKEEDPNYKEALLATLHCPPAEYGINRTT